ncbi:phospholipase-like protein, partial [Tanacetum coccineum]
INTSCPEMHNAKVLVAGMGIDKADENIYNSNANDNDVNQGILVSFNAHMSNSSGHEMPNAVVMVACMGIDKPDGHNDNPNANDNDVNKGIDPMPISVSPDMVNAEVAICSMGFQNEVAPNVIYEGNVVSTKELDVLIQVACDGMGIDKADGIDFLQHDDHVDCSVAKPNDHPIADIGENEFADDFMDVLNDEESLPKVKKERKKSDMKTNYVLRSVHCDFILPPDFEKDVSGQPNMRSINELMTMEVFVEQLSRPQNCKKDKVSLPDGLAEYLQMNDPPNYRFPWGYRDIPVDREFCTLIYGWISCGVLDNPTQIGPWYPVAWRDVEKVYFPVNEPKRHWCLAELHITIGVVTFYDSLGWVCSNRRLWWRNMKRTLPQQLTLYLNEHGVLQSKGIAVERYEITYKFPTVIEQADL